MLLLSLIAFFVCLVLSAFFSSSETAFVALDRYHLDYLIRKGNKKAKAIHGLLSPPDKLLATILVGNTFVNAAAASLATFLFVSLLKDNRAVLYATLTTTFMILLFSEITPKIYAAQHPKRLSFFYIYPLKLITFLFYPFVKAFTLISNFILKTFGQEKASFPPPLGEDEIRIILTSRMERSNLPFHQKKMLTSILEMRDLLAKEIMVPRTNVTAIEIKSSFKKIIKTILSSEYSRFPVYQGRLDEIKGIIHAKDIIPYLVKKKKFNIYDILRKPLFIPESAKLESVLRQMQENNVHLAIVVDEYGSMEGIVTLEDILEEIVGEIRDEYDINEEELIREIEKNVFLIQGYAPVKEINKRLKINLPEKSGYTTIAGFIFSRIKKIPKENDEILYNGIKIYVQKMKGTQIRLVKIRLKDKDEHSS